MISTKRHVFMIQERGGVPLSRFAAEYELREQHTMRFDKVMDIMRQVLHALGHCHQRGVSHRSLSLESILVDDRYHVRLIRFSHASKQGKGPAPTLTAGDDGFYAPEQVVTSHFNAESTDVWSVGCVLLRLVLGARQFGEVWLPAYQPDVWAFIQSLCVVVKGLLCPHLCCVVLCEWTQVVKDEPRFRSIMTDAVKTVHHAVKTNERMKKVHTNHSKPCK